MDDKWTYTGASVQSGSEAIHTSDTLTFVDEKATPVALESESTFTSSDISKTCDAALSGWRYWGTMSGLYLGVFLVTLDMTIVNTALVAISNDLHDFSRATWIINAYVLSWTCCMILWAQFSHTMGRKPALLVAVLGFTLFSMGCALARSTVQLITLRAFQGLTGAGVVTIPAVLIPELIRPASFPKYIAFLSLVSAVSFAFGPLIGGAIATNTTWRWVFWINLPIGVIICLIDLISLPDGVPHHSKPKHERPKVRFASLETLDLVGAAIYVCASVTVVTAFEEAGLSFSWNSVFMICFLVVSAISWAVFICWQRHVTLSLPSVNPLMTWKFCDRKPVALFICSALIWVPFTTALIQLPLQYQIIQGMSPEAAGIRLLPFIVLHPVGTAFASLLSGKYRFNVTAGLLVGATIQFIAGICFATRPIGAAEEGRVLRSQYAFQILLGFGNGLAYSFNFNSIPHVFAGQRALIPSAMGINSQLRYLGGAVGLAVITSAMNATLRYHLPDALVPTGGDAFLRSIDSLRTLGVAAQQQARIAFADVFLLQWGIVCGFIGLQVVAILFTV